MNPFDFSEESLLSVTREWVLSRTSEKAILDFYLGRTYGYGVAFHSPFRTDANPSCTIFVSQKGRPMFRDWTESRPCDCFEVAQRTTRIFNFHQLLSRIALDLGLVNREPRSPEALEEEKRALLVLARTQKASLRVRIQAFQDVDWKYLRQFHLDDPALLERFRIYSPEIVWLHGEIHYVWNRRDPAIAYYFGTADDGSERWKVYFYRRRRGMRFLGNTSRIQGWVQLPERANVVVLTKSMKDVLCLTRFGVPAIAMQGETTIPYPRIVDELRDRFENVYSLYDFDHAGIASANRLRKTYGIEPLFLTNGRFGTRYYGAKDFSDFLRDYGTESTMALLREAVRHTGVKLTLPYEHHSSSSENIGTDRDLLSLADRNTPLPSADHAFEESAQDVLPPWDADSEEVR